MYSTFQNHDAHWPFLLVSCLPHCCSCSPTAFASAGCSDCGARRATVNRTLSKSATSDELLSSGILSASEWWIGMWSERTGTQNEICVGGYEIQSVNEKKKKKNGILIHRFRRSAWSYESPSLSWSLIESETLSYQSTNPNLSRKTRMSYCPKRSYDYGQLRKCMITASKLSDIHLDSDLVSLIANFLLAACPSASL